jgi:hypothetical protein
MLYRHFWLIGLSLLVVLSLVALWEVSYDTCGEQIPILLSRALTTDPYRGLTLAFCLVAVASSLYLDSILLIAGFFGFFSAFLVSMFQTNAHNALILVSAIFVMYECYPQNNTVWKVHWWLTVVAGLVCAGWLVYSVYGCVPEDYECRLYFADTQVGDNCTSPPPASVQCSRCSWWYISEYVFFWSMYGLVYWIIPDGLVWRDNVHLVQAAAAPKAIVKESGSVLMF